MAKFNTEWAVQPHGSLRQVADGIWSVEGSIVMPLGRFPRRMTVIVLRDGKLALWSPIALDDTQMAKLESLGSVGFLIVPNQGHRLDLKAWTTRFPAAQVVAPPGARDAVAEAAPVDATSNVLDDPSVEFELVAGTKLDEFALTITRQDGVTLVLNDILSSISHPQGIGANVLARLFGFGVRRPRTSRLVRHMYVKDPKAVAQQFRRWASIPSLRRLILSHVDIVDVSPSEVLERAANDL